VELLICAKKTLTKLDRKIRKLLAIHGHYHNKADVDSCYVPRKRKRRGLIQLEEAYIAAVTRLMEYAQSKEDPLIQTVRTHQQSHIDG